VASSVMVRRDAAEKAGMYDVTLQACENWDLWIRIARDYEVEYIDEKLTSYRVHPNNMSKNFEKIFQARMQVIDKHLPAESNVQWIKEQRREALFKTHVSLAKGYIEPLRLDEARRELTMALKIKPNCTDCWKLYFKTLLGPRIFGWVRQRRGRTA